MLYIVSTPIGNLSDMTFRAVETLKNVDLVLCEDTRVSGKLFSHFDIHTKMISYHKFSEKAKLDEVIAILHGGKDIALISDAGTPLVSDPGNLLVARAKQEGIEVSAVPGCCAVINGLVLSGFDLSSFCFCGFLPAKKRGEFVEKYKVLASTLVFYVTKNSVNDDVKDLCNVLGNRKAVLVREMTKMFEEAVSFNLADGVPAMKGEMVLCVEGNFLEQDFASLSVSEHLMVYIKSGIDKKEAVKKVAKERGMQKNDVYALLFND